MKNLIIRTVSGVVFLAVMLLALLSGDWFEGGKYIFATLMSFALVMMMVEFFRMTMGNVYKASRVLAIVGACLMFAVTFLVQSTEAVTGRFITLAFIPLFVVMINSLYVKDKKDFGKFSNIYTGILYIAVPWTLLNFTAFDSNHDFNGLMLLCMFIIIWVSDVGAYLFGSTLGQKFGPKLFPTISPHKSWVGCIGGFACALGAGYGMHGLDWLPFSELAWYHCLAIAAIMNITGVYGDLIESQWKRHYGVKDSGNIIPGHGGMLDRFDSALVAIPAATVYMMCFDIL